MLARNSGGLFIAGSVVRVLSPQVLREGSQGYIVTFGDAVYRCVDASELRHALTTLCPELPDEKVDELLREANIDDDGKINIAEFVKVRSAVPCPGLPLASDHATGLLV